MAVPLVVIIVKFVPGSADQAPGCCRVAVEVLHAKNREEEEEEGEQAKGFVSAANPSNKQSLVLPA